MPEVLAPNIEAKPGYKHTKLGWIPEGWHVRRLEEISDISRGRFSPRPRNDPKFYGGDIPFVQTGDVTNSSGVILSHSQTLNQEGLKVSRLFKRDTILMTIASNIGHCAILGYDMACPDSLVGINPNTETNVRYLNYILRSSQKRLEYVAPGGQKNINIEFLKPFLVIHPPLPEQQKIARILSTWDAAITKMEALIAQKQQLKKGLMQQLLTGKKRFAEFVKSDKTKSTKLGDVPEDWEVLRLKEILEESHLGGNYENSESEEGLPLMKMGNLKRGKFTLAKVQNVPVSSDYERRHLLRKGDILFNTRNTLELVGKVALWREELPLALFNSNLLRLKFTSQVERSNEFANYYFNSHVGLRQLRSFAIGTTSVAAIYTRDLMRFRVMIPSLAEQQKIAVVLSEADVEIESLNQHLVHLKAQKKGLMQKLLTGAVRVKIEQEN